MKRFAIFVDTGPSSLDQEKDSWLKEYTGPGAGVFESKEAAEKSLYNPKHIDEIGTGLFWLTVRQIDENGRPLRSK